jgi:photosystem II stability/assembly factor-like uncharacterized protein
MKITVGTIILLFFYIISLSQEQWKPTNGPYGGNVLSIAVTSKGKIFVATLGGLFYSSNKGDIWERADSIDTGIYSVVVDKNDKIYATSYYAIYLSNDGGENWEKISEEYGIFKLFISNNFIFGLFNGPGGILRSENGITWTSVGLNSYAEDIAKNSVGHIYCVGGNNIFRSTDNGNNWSVIKQFTDIAIADIFINQRDEIFVGTYYNGIFRSTDSGNIWIEINNGLENLTWKSIKGFCTNNNNTLVFAATYEGVYKSTNNGDKWELSSNDISDKEVNVLFYTSDNYLFAGTSGSGFFKSSDEGSIWSLKNNGLINTTLLSLAIDNEGTIYAATKESGIFYSNNKGQTWNSIFPGGWWESICVSPNGYIYAKGDLLYRSTDKGNTWSVIDSIYFSGLYINSVGELYAFTKPGDGDEIYTSLDDGITWEKIATMSGIHNIAFNNSNDIFVATSDNIYRSTDKGKTWKKLSDFSNWGVKSIKINSKEKIFVDTEYGIYTSTDNGNSWIRLNEYNSEFIYINKLDHIFFNTVWLEGIFLSTDNGLSWKYTGLDGKQINCITSNNEGYNYVGVEGQGVMRYFNNEPVVNVEKNPFIDLFFSLSQNYPNPFNPTTTIRYQITQAGFVILKVYNILGKEVATLVNEEKTAGIYYYQLSIENFQLPSGVYFYQLQSGSFMETKKFVLMK